MMKGGRPGRLTATDRQKAMFLLRHEKQIAWAVDHLPRTSAALPAVVVKCLIKYDSETVAEFCNSLRNSLFKGQDDPAFLLWKFIQKHRGHDTIAMYQRAVCAARAYMEGRKISILRPLKEDIFNWDEDWTVPDELLSNWNPDRLPREDKVDDLLNTQ